VRITLLDPKVRRTEGERGDFMEGRHIPCQVNSNFFSEFVMSKRANGDKGLANSVIYKRVDSLR